MAIFGRFRRSLRSLFSAPSHAPLPSEGEQPEKRDTLSVIHDLSRIVHNNPEAIDIYMALGNLFRSQGNLENAVRIRERLIARPGMNTRFKARASYELGLDYRRAGMVDRALEAFTQALRSGYDESAVIAELAILYADSGNFEKAAEEYGILRHSLAQAHYLVRSAEDISAEGNDTKAARRIKKALDVYPGSVEAWSALISMAALAEEWRKTASLLEKGLDRITPPLRFLPLETLHEILMKTCGAGRDTTSATTSFAADLCTTVLPALEKQEPHILLHYYGALFLKAMGDIDGANLWIAKALVVQPDFWAARLELLSLAALLQQMPPVIALQLEYFTRQMHAMKRFYCTRCGLRQDTIFYHCPRCGSWHSISFRLTLQE